MKSMTITIGYEMDENELNEILEELGLTINDFENEEDVYRFVVNHKFNYGLGCEVEF